MNKLMKRIRKTVGMDLSVIALLGGVALATTFAAAQAWSVLSFATEHVAVYGSMQIPMQSLKPSASEEQSSSNSKDRAQRRKEAKEKREKQRRERMLKSKSSSSASSVTSSANF